MKEGWVEGLSKECPKCEARNLPYFGKVLRNNDMIFQYKCSNCRQLYIRRDESPPTVEIWNTPGRPKGGSDA